MDRKWDIRTIYLYLVSFVTLMMVLYGTVSAFEAAFEFFFQPPDIYGPSVLEMKLTQSGQVADQDTLKELARIEQERTERNMRYNNLRRVFNSLATLSVGLPVYMYHWRMIKRKENDLK